jgi:hypothetical protein
MKLENNIKMNLREAGNSSAGFGITDTEPSDYDASELIKLIN